MSRAIIVTGPMLKQLVDDPPALKAFLLDQAGEDDLIIERVPARWKRRLELTLEDVHRELTEWRVRQLSEPTTIAMHSETWKRMIEDDDRIDGDTPAAVHSLWGVRVETDDELERETVELR